MRRLLLLALLMLGGCQTFVETNRPASACSDLVPEEWAKGVDHATYPPPTADQGDWVAYANEEYGNVDDANGREKQTLTIVARCEAHDAALVKSLTHKPFLGIF